MAISSMVMPLAYSLSTGCPIKWTSQQERALDKDNILQAEDEASEKTGAAAHAKQAYLRFLWLPESIMSLRLFVPTMLRVQWVSPSDKLSTHPLHDILRPLLLTPRTASQKYHERINQMLENDNDADGDEEHMMWLAFKNAKGDEELEAQTQDPNAEVSVYDAEEAWKDRWLARMEQREVQIQILLHFLLLSLPGAPSLPAEEPRPELPAHLSPSKKRRRPRKEATPPLPTLALEEYLELFMDKLSMWQLMATLDEQDAERKRAKGKQKAVDERDWMQMFCEHIVEPRFKSKLPELCRLLRSKVFPESPFTDDSDSPHSTPPASPRPAPKRLKTSAASQPKSTSRSRHSSSASRRRPPPAEDAHALQRARSRSLSMSLEQERARSQSVVVPQKKRAIVREVSMTTAFKGKAQAQARERESAAARAKEGERVREAQRAKDAGAGAEKARRAASAKGVTLVAATPVKPKDRGGRSQAQASGEGVVRLPKCELEREVQGRADDDDDWASSSSPDVLLLGSTAAPSQGGKSAVEAGVMEDDEEEDVLGWMGRNTHLALVDTPTKPKKVRR